MASHSLGPLWGVGEDAVYPIAPSFQSSWPKGRWDTCLGQLSHQHGIRDPSWSCAIFLAASIESLFLIIQPAFCHPFQVCGGSMALSPGWAGW